ncbi:hypothetical protein HJC23_002430 [Cyclotella cryptica]|uniref:Uncharacterized protein n=1 Tax=Cyclotella cryptica TaxID=29204 RepID=A0ABD3PUL8_9STRA|eukprot:CCRYP_011151-RA/>CCRYP_011151-RA protein AED:0.04 eAED:-0.05 QI:0/-1/0/1/-1/1/1/0/466
MYSLCSFIGSSYLATPLTNTIPSFRPPIFHGNHFRMIDRHSSNFGVNALQMKNIFSAEWTNLLSPDSNIVPPRKIEPPRSGAVTFSTRDETKLFTFGGYAEEESSIGTPPDRYVVNDLWTFHPYKESSASPWGWTKIDQHDRSYVPGPRLATAIAVLPCQSQPSAVLLGGWDPQEPGTGGIILDDVSVLDLDALQWSQPRLVEPADKVMTIPDGPTSRHVAVPVCFKKSAGQEAEEAILLHNHRCEDHVFLLSLSANENTNEKNDKFRGQWKRQTTNGDAPSSRGLHCAIQLNDPKSNLSKSVVLFGGAAKDGTMSNEAFVLDLSSWKWSKLDCSGDKPSPRAGACLCELDENTVILFGGAERGDQGLVGLNDVWSLNINIATGTGVWTCLIENESVDGEKLDASRPPGRNAATLTRMNAQSLLPKDLLCRNSSEGKNDAYFLLQGGWNPFRKTFDDVFVLRVASK